MSERTKTILFVSILAALLVGGFLAAWQSVLGKDLIKGMIGFAGMFFTPFILEISSALLGLTVLLLFLRHKLKEEGDGWVVMEVEDKEDSDPEKAGESTPIEQSSSPMEEKRALAEEKAAVER